MAPEKVRVITSGIDSQLFHPGSRAEARARLGILGSGPVLLFIGNLVPVKGLDVLVEAMFALGARRSRVHVLRDRSWTSAHRA